MIDPVTFVLLAWPLLIAALFRIIGPRRAVLVAVIGGFLLLPPGEVMLDLPGFTFRLNKWNTTGLALVLNCLLFDRRAVLQLRPTWWDVPMAAWYLVPLFTLLAGRGSTVDVYDLMVGRGLGWVAPYVAARIYFSRVEGPAEVATAVVLGGLAYVPLCLYEQIAGPDNYLITLIYGIPHSGNVDRLGGWRPNGFLGDGLVLASWMALTAVTALWLALGRVWTRPHRAWLAAVVLIATTVSCRGVYGYLLLAAGVPVALLSHWLRTRVLLVALAILPVLYMVFRLSGQWSGRALVDAASFTGRANTIEFRLLAEQVVIEPVLAANPVLGFNTYVWNQTFSHWPDGGWLHVLWMSGIAGLLLWLVALVLAPMAAALARARPVAPPLQPAMAAAALTCWCLLQLLDTLHNRSYIPTLALIAGTLIGFGRLTPQRPPDPTGF